MVRMIVNGTISQKFLEILTSPDKSSLVLETRALMEHRRTKHETEGNDWRSNFTPLKVSEDTKEHIEQAKGKEIKRSKEETRGVCYQYISEFSKY